MSPFWRGSRPIWNWLAANPKQPVTVFAPQFYNMRNRRFSNASTDGRWKQRRIYGAHYRHMVERIALHVTMPAFLMNISTWPNACASGTSWMHCVRTYSKRSSGAWQALVRSPCSVRPRVEPSSGAVPRIGVHNFLWRRPCRSVLDAPGVFGWDIFRQISIVMRL